MRNIISTKNQWIIFGSIVLLTILSYSPLFNAQFVNWDDPGYAFAETDIINFNIIPLLTKVYVNHYHPLTMLTLATDYHLWGEGPFGFHMTNLFLHLLNTLMVFLISKRLLSTKVYSYSTWISLFVAAFFALHPLHVQAVAWISERKELLASFFYLLAIWQYLKFRQENYNGFWILPVFILGLLSKSTLVTLPLLLLLIDWYYDDLTWYNLKQKIPLFCLSLLGGIVPILMHTEVERVSSSWSLIEHLQHIGNFFVFQISKTFIPTQLVAYYQEGSPYLTWSDYLMTLFFLLVVTLIFILNKISRKILALGLGWFIIGLILLSGVIPYSQSEAFSDRYHYFPSIGFFLAGTTVVSLFLTHFQKRLLQVSFLAMTLLLIIALSIKTFFQTQIWDNSQSLWQKTFELFPQSETVLFNLAMSYNEKHEGYKALVILQRMEQLHPNGKTTELLRKMLRPQ